MEKEEDGDQIKKILKELQRKNFITAQNHITTHGLKILKSLRCKFENDV
tara:strand:+ start:738 stop:884 length:147 start_codon:yes stop_codon:yes gene_type:complete